MSLFCMWISTFSNTVYWRDYLFPIIYLQFPSQVLVSHIHMSFFPVLSILFHYLHVHFYASTILFWLVLHFNRVWNQKVWSLQLLKKYFSGLLCLFGVCCGSRLILATLYFCEKCNWLFDRGCTESIDGFVL